MCLVLSLLLLVATFGYLLLLLPTFGSCICPRSRKPPLPLSELHYPITKAWHANEVWLQSSCLPLAFQFALVLAIPPLSFENYATHLLKLGM